MPALLDPWLAQELQQTPRLTDTEIVALTQHCAAGSLAAQATLITRFRPLLRQQLNRLRGVPMAAVDKLVSAADEALINATTHFNPDHGARFYSYAKTCVRHAMIKALKHHRRHADRLVSLPDSLAQGVMQPRILVPHMTPDLTPLSLLELKETLALIRERVAQLHSPTRDLLTLHYGLDDMVYRSVAESAALLGLTLSQATGRLNWGIHKIRRQLTEPESTAPLRRGKRACTTE